MSGHIWKAITNIVGKLKKKPEPTKPVERFSFDNCANPSGCRISIKCFDKRKCHYDLRK